MIETNFKQTEIGLIPHDWEVRELGNTATIIGGGTPSTAVPAYWNGDIQWFTPAEITNAPKYVSKSQRKINSLGLKNSSAKLLPAGTVLLTTRATIGARAILLNEACTNQGFQSLVVKDGFCNEYIFYYIPLIIGEMLNRASGSTFPEISPKKLSKISIATPPTITEQKRIADALSKIDSLIVGLDELLEKKRAIKTGTMQQLLSGKKRLQGFTGEWKSVNLGDVIKVRNGYPFESATYSEIGTYKIVTIANVQNGRLDLSSYNIISSLPKNIQPCQILRIGDILISMTGNVGRICKVTEKNCLLNQRVGLLQIVSKKIDEDFLYVVLNNVGFEKAMIEKGQGAAQSNIGNKDIENYVFNCPPTIEEQNAIANILSSMDTEIASLEQKRDKYIAIKQGMMQQLLTGKIRLV